MNEQMTLFDIPSGDYNSPLGYIGGKKKLWPLFKQFIPSDINHMISPFIGGGSIELRCAANGIKVEAYDKFDLLVNFWQTFLNDIDELTKCVSKIYPISTEEGKEYFKTHLTTIDNPIKQAAIFWCINRQSWGAKMFADKDFYEKKVDKYTPEGFLKWRTWQNKNITVKLQDCFVTLEQSKGIFTYLDPPYVGLEKMYGIKGKDNSFDHERLYDILSQNDRPWILSYGKHDDIYRMYSKYKILEPEWKYLFNSAYDLSPNELLIINC